MKTRNFFASLLLITFFLPACLPAYSQKPEKVYSIVKQIKSFDWYIKQAKLWKAEINKDGKNADAWVNFYAANRMARMMNPAEWNKLKGDYIMELSEIINSASKNIPDTYELYNIIIWDQGLNGKDNFHLLSRAFEINPDRPEVLDNFVLYYEINYNRGQRAIFNKKWFEMNDMSTGILNFNYNVLMSIEDDAIILTNGDNDTYPLWMIQDVFGIKKNVAVMNISLLAIDHYRNKLFENNGVTPFTPAANDTINLNAKWAGIIRHLINNTSRPVYFASTMDSKFYSEYEKNLYLTGLVFKYSKEDFDNVALIRKNYEHIYMLDYLKNSFANDLSKSVVSQLNMCYLPSLLKLYNHYNFSGDALKKEDTENLIYKIGRVLYTDEEINTWFE